MFNINQPTNIFTNRTIHLLAHIEALSQTYIRMFRRVLFGQAELWALPIGEINYTITLSFHIRNDGHTVHANKEEEKYRDMTKYQHKMNEWI